MFLSLNQTSKTNFSNNRGFTIAEVLVAIAILAVAVLGTFNVLSYFKLQYNRNFLMVDSRLSTTLGERYLYTHLKNAFPSFNNLKDVDDNNQNFYDLSPEYPVTLRPDAAQKRKLTLEPGKKTQFHIIVGNSKESPPLYIEPAKLFTYSAAGIGTPGTLTFVGLTNDGYITTLVDAMNIKDSAKRPPLWKDGNILYLYLPATVRPASAADSAFVSPYCFFGRIEGSTLTPQNFGGLVTCRNHIANNNVGDLADFMLRMPSQAGGIPIVLLRSVSVFRYDLVPDPNNAQNFNLTFSTWQGSDFGSPQIAATNVVKVEFSRESVADTVITVQVTPKAVKRVGEE